MGHLLTVEPQRSGNLQPLEFSRQAKPQAKNSSLQTFVVNSRSMFDGTVTATDMDRATDAREKGRIGITGSANAYAGSSGRVTSERIGRDLNPLGRGDGNAYVGGAQNLGRIAPVLPKSSAQPGWGNTVNNGPSIGSEAALTQCCGCIAIPCPECLEVTEGEECEPWKCPCAPACASSEKPRCCTGGEFYGCDKNHLTEPNPLHDCQACKDIADPSDAVSPGNSNPSYHVEFNLAELLAQQCTKNFLKVLDCKIKSTKNPLLKALFLSLKDSTQCVLGAIRGMTGKYQWGGCCGLPWPLNECCNEPPYHRMINCGPNALYIVNKVIVCPSLFTSCQAALGKATVPTGYHALWYTCCLARLILHEAVHSCMILTGLYEGLGLPYGYGKNPADNLAGAILLCCGCPANSWRD